ncbi:uncharacterized protein MYCFIDRAFT_177863 [Pseudocercospora fijiensis CIRAD86]|uniref:Uncharacterized protein n=1 Tax=Pseudocercospora fijiensis (strain CIRAD86) TaxID=383855 RepID=M3AQ56_PSEFD|nr:uncharacterized protein MYCFIDRAFT_177863 [Pseudocercospora fijiensis CIRAD86]EME79228.1 hypothetical protein MYCFIDRAFT_177863 [Pseudocercospora fijiensis CIRAD86]
MDRYDAGMPDILENLSQTRDFEISRISKDQSFVIRLRRASPLHLQSRFNELNYASTETWAFDEAFQVESVTVIQTQFRVPGAYRDINGLSNVDTRLVLSQKFCIHRAAHYRAARGDVECIGAKVNAGAIAIHASLLKWYGVVEKASSAMTDVSFPELGSLCIFPLAEGRQISQGRILVPTRHLASSEGSEEDGRLLIDTAPSKLVRVEDKRPKRAYKDLCDGRCCTTARADGWNYRDSMMMRMSLSHLGRCSPVGGGRYAELRCGELQEAPLLKLYLNSRSCWIKQIGLMVGGRGAGPTRPRWALQLMILAPTNGSRNGHFEQATGCDANPSEDATTDAWRNEGDEGLTKLVLFCDTIGSVARCVGTPPLATLDAVASDREAVCRLQATAPSPPFSAGYAISSSDGAQSDVMYTAVDAVDDMMRISRAAVVVLVGGGEKSQRDGRDCAGSGLASAARTSLARAYSVGQERCVPRASQRPRRGPSATDSKT